jgi:hypothetical protein
MTGTVIPRRAASQYDAQTRVGGSEALWLKLQRCAALKGKFDVVQIKAGARQYEVLSVSKLTVPQEGLEVGLRTHFALGSDDLTILIIIYQKRHPSFGTASRIGLGLMDLNNAA